LFIPNFHFVRNISSWSRGSKNEAIELVQDLSSLRPILIADDFTDGGSRLRLPNSLRIAHVFAFASNLPYIHAASSRWSVSPLRPVAAQSQSRFS